MRTALLLPTFATLVAFSAQAADWLYLTVPGDTLSGIGQTYLKNPKDWPKVQSVNGVPLPRLLPANSKLKIPVELLKVTPAPVTVIAVNGNVRFKPADGTYKPLTADTSLNGGETVLTGPGASVSYRFADNTQLTQQSKSKLVFGRLTGYGKTGMVSTDLSLSSGRLEANAAKQLSPAGGFRVHTPVAVAGLRGTTFRVSVAEDGKRMSNEVTEGAVAVQAQGQQVQVPSGFGTYTEQGKPPKTPYALLAKPDLSQLPTHFNRLPLQLNWPALAEAQTWRVQLAGDADFVHLLHEEVVAQPVLTWPIALPQGDYFLRVRGIDRNGLEGHDAQHGFHLSLSPLPPLPQKPALGERLDRHDVELAWHAGEAGQGYLLQLAPTPEFSQGLIEQRLANIESTRVNLPNGEWHWRMASLDAQGQVHAFSAHRAFRVQAPPTVPQLAETRQLTHDAVTTLNWQVSPEAQSYRVQVAAKADFSELLSDQQTTDNQLRTSVPAAGEWYWRVAALGPDNLSSGFSQAAVWRYRPAPETPKMPQVRQENGLLIAHWTGTGKAYRVQLSDNQAFSPVLASHIVAGNETRMIAPAPGNYWLRVIALDADQQESAASPAAPIAVATALKPWWLLPLLILAH